jgi:hypothetical protein
MKMPWKGDGFVQENIKAALQVNKIPVEQPLISSE